MVVGDPLCICIGADIVFSRAPRLGCLPAVRYGNATPRSIRFSIHNGRVGNPSYGAATAQPPLFRSRLVVAA
jgi:hypothetical protein